MLLLILCGWLSQTAPAAEQPAELALLSRWVRAVERHEPARADDEAATIAVWPMADFRTALATLRDLRDALAKAYQADGTLEDRQNIRTRRGHWLSVGEAQTLLGLTDDEARRGDVNRLLKRGAMLHSDIAMLAHEGLISATGPTVPGASAVGKAVLVSDGQIRAADDTGRHWVMARSLLDAVTPNPGGDEWVRQWYHAAVARMRGDKLLASAGPLLDRAVQLFPKDAGFQFHAGCLHEALASPPIQVVIGAAAQQRGIRVAGSPSGPNWRQAASHFTSALGLQPAWPEARVRLGRVLGLLGRHTDAAIMLRRGLDEATDLLLVYWASLFLGVEEQALGRDAEALASYERARTCRPGAQAPRLAISQLARRAGNRALALSELRAVLTLPQDDVSRYDPLWEYHKSRTSEADLLFAELRRQLAQGGIPGGGAVR
jgi:tetratricopeptide (TPR) repeat protein